MGMSQTSPAGDLLVNPANGACKWGSLGLPSPPPWVDPRASMDTVGSRRLRSLPDAMDPPGPTGAATLESTHTAVR